MRRRFPKRGANAGINKEKIAKWCGVRECCAIEKWKGKMVPLYYHYWWRERGKNILWTFKTKFGSTNIEDLYSSCIQSA